MRALLCEPMKEPLVINTDDSLFAFQRLLGKHIDLADDFLEPIAIIYNLTDYHPGLGNVFFICDSNGNLRHVISDRILVAGVQGEALCSLTDEQIKRYTRIFRSTVLYFPMQNADQSDVENHITHKNKTGRSLEKGENKC